MSKPNILLGIAGSIAAYKSIELIRLLRKAGADVQVILTASARQFVTTTTLQAISGHRVRDGLWDEAAEAAMGHIELARWADRIVIAPATADLLADLAMGKADELLTTLVLAASAPLLIAPAMNQAMWHHPRVQENVKRLQQSGVEFIGPEQGIQACGDEGLGRMSEPAIIAQQVLAQPVPLSCLRGRRILITAGPTREAIDPVRYLSNYSSGKMGYALAAAAQAAGASVILVSGPTALSPPPQLKTIVVDSAQEMAEAVQRALIDVDIFIACAAVADYRPKAVVTEKLRSGQAGFVIECEPNPDILQTVAQSGQVPFCVGFAAQSHEVECLAREKLQRKQLDMIIANDISDPAIGFASDDNRVMVLSADQTQHLAQQSKQALSRQLIQLIAEQYHAKCTN